MISNVNYFYINYYLYFANLSNILSITDNTELFLITYLKELNIYYTLYRVIYEETREYQT